MFALCRENSALFSNIIHTFLIVMFRNSYVFFYSCSCQQDNGKPCHLIFSNEDRIKRRLDVANMMPRDQILILLWKLSCTINVSPMTCSTRQAPGSEKVRERVRRACMIEGKSVCRETFMYLHATSRDRLTALLKWYRNNGLVPKEKHLEDAVIRRVRMVLMTSNNSLHS